MTSENPYARLGFSFAQAWDRMREVMPWPPSLEVFRQELQVVNRARYVTPLLLATELAKQYQARFSDTE